ncbi:hypothetical protein BaRGS_00034143 [Batillaria attramentaria]|uniref:Sulfotransferase domain-containing protein n=1 Tax=Batillaria attramentaria TaxID=370345 RepID=A0ABD0JIE9_9CAEN
MWISLSLLLSTHCNYTPAEYHKESASIMEVFLSCSFETMNSKDIDNFQLRNSEGSRLLWRCVQRKGNFTAVDVVDCFINARRTCASRPVKLVKTIRFRGSAAAEMMLRHEDLRIIYLVRDPRGTILSQQRVFQEFKFTQIVNFTTYFCQTFREDLANLEPLFDKYPDRIKLLRYETLAENPMKVSEELYKFLRLTFTADVEEFVYNSTSAGKSSKGDYDTFKANSTEAAYAWRNGAVFKEVQVIDKICGDIYLKLGYLPVKSIHELEDRHRPLKRDIIFHRNSI